MRGWGSPQAIKTGELHALWVFFFFLRDRRGGKGKGEGGGGQLGNSKLEDTLREREREREREEREREERERERERERGQRERIITDKIIYLQWTFFNQAFKAKKNHAADLADKVQEVRGGQLVPATTLTPSTLSVHRYSLRWK